MKDVALSAKSHLRFVETAQKTFVTLFGQFVSPAVEADKVQSASDVQQALRISFDISKDVMEKCPRLHDLHLDVTSYLHKIQEEMSSVEGREGQTKGGEGFNFYHDACVDEAKQCVPLLVDTRERVLTLLDQWPGKPISLFPCNKQTDPLPCCCSSSRPERHRQDGRQDAGIRHDRTISQTPNRNGVGTGQVPGTMTA